MYLNDRAMNRTLSEVCVNIVSSAAVKPRLDILCLIAIIPIIKIGRYASVFFSFDVRKVYFGSTLYVQLVAGIKKTEIWRGGTVS